MKRFAWIVGMAALTLLSGAALAQDAPKKDDALAKTDNKKEALAPGIKAEALWDGRKIAPFHALDDPKMVLASEADFLEEGDYVLGVTINGQSRAYPTRFIWWHHIVNDKVGKPETGETPFAVTYCSVCNTGILYDPIVNGKTLKLDFYGLYNAVVTLCDRDTASVFLQATGDFIKGDLLGTKLKSKPLLDTTWSHWKRLHPDTVVMSPDTEYKRAYSPKERPEPRGYERFPAPFFAPSLTYKDKRLPMFDKVLAVAQPGEKESNPTLRRAYPVKTLKEANGVLNDTLGKTPVTAFLDLDSTSASAFSRILDGKTLTFEARKLDGDKYGIFDKETGTRWNIEGKGEEGTLAGKTLTRLENHLSQWYGWVAYFPDTSIYGRTDPPQPVDPKEPEKPAVEKPDKEKEKPGK